jgi:hypothetical protein
MAWGNWYKAVFERTIFSCIPVTAGISWAYAGFSKGSTQFLENLHHFPVNTFFSENICLNSLEEPEVIVCLRFYLFTWASNLFLFVCSARLQFLTCWKLWPWACIQAFQKESTLFRHFMPFPYKPLFERSA